MKRKKSKPSIDVSKAEPWNGRCHVCGRRPHGGNVWAVNVTGAEIRLCSEHLTDLHAAIGATLEAAT